MGSVSLFHLFILYLIPSMFSDDYVISTALQILEGAKMEVTDNNVILRECERRSVFFPPICAFFLAHRLEYSMALCLSPICE